MLKVYPTLDFFSLFRPITKPKIWAYLSYVDIVNQYRRTLLGPVWILLSLVIFSVAMGTVYSKVFSISFSEYVTYITTGMIAWNWAAGILVGSGMVYVSNSGLLLDHPVDKSYLIWANAMSQLIVFIHQFPVILFFYIFGLVKVNLNILYIFPSLAIVFMINVGLASVLSIVITKYRDFHKILTNLTIIIMLTTPIFWMTDIMTGARSLIYLMNPFYYIIEIIRDPLLGKEPSLFKYSVSILIAISSMLLGTIMHKKYSKGVVFHL